MLTIIDPKPHIYIFDPSSLIIFTKYTLIHLVISNSQKYSQKGKIILWTTLNFCLKITLSYYEQFWIIKLIQWMKKKYSYFKCLNLIMRQSYNMLTCILLLKVMRKKAQIIDIIKHLTSIFKLILLKLLKFTISLSIFTDSSNP